jgi:hypothetical protein
MTTPNLPPDGHLRRAPRDWLESLCERQPDGTWLVQAPLSRGWGPLLYLLPDAAARDQFLKRASGLIWLRVALNHWLGPLVVVLPVWSMLFFFVSIEFVLLNFMLLAMGGAVFGAHFLREQSLFTWLAKAAVTRPAGWKRPDVVVRRWEEWQGLYLSLALPGLRVLNRGVFWTTAGVIAAAAVAYLNLCQGIGILDQLFLDWGPRDRPGVARRCGVFGGWGMLAAFLLALAILANLRWDDRRQRAGAARPVASDGPG